MKFLDSVPWSLTLVMCLTLGLAPFLPAPHIWEKLQMLVAGDLVRALDWADLALHGAPFVVLIAKALRRLTSGSGSGVTPKV